jgi:Family of unknown function (DUF5681)
VTRHRKSRRLDNRPKRDYPVGYGRAPVSGRWKPGQSGNPKGRKKLPKTVGKTIEEALMRKVTIEEDGRRVRLTVQEVIIRNLVNAAARRDLKAVITLFRLRDHYQDSNEMILNPAELDPNDQAIIEEYLKKAQTASTSPGPQASTETRPDSEEGPNGDSKPNRDPSDGESS